MSFNRFALVAGMAVAALFPALVQAEDLPARKPGLWESSMKSPDGKPPMVVKQCIDAATDKSLMGMTSGMCDLKWKRVGGDRIETETTCKMGPISASGKGVITGDFNSSVRVETTTTTTASGEGMPAGAPKLNIPPTTQTMVVEAKWLGPCEAGQKPGDMIMPDGKVMQMPKMPAMPKL
jgi:hypothetical protein